MTDPTYIMGISSFYHDSAACLVKDGNIVATALEERFTRKKHDPRFPHNAIQYCLDEGGIDAHSVDYVGFYEKPWLKSERIMATFASVAPRGIDSFLYMANQWFEKRKKIRNNIRKIFGTDTPLLFIEHHESHAASAFFPSPFSEAAILTLDGVGEWNTTTIGIGKGNKIRLIKEINFPHSLGLLYSTFTYYLGFRVNFGEYKMMGLAPYGEPKYVDLILNELIHINDDGSFKMNMKYFGYVGGLTMTNRAFYNLFGGAPRKPESKITQKHMNIAASIQKVTEKAMLNLANHAHEITKQKNLCLAGGVALNCVANGRILRESKFKDLWIQPAASDAGGALGIAQYIWYQHLGNMRQNTKSDQMQGAYLGPTYSKTQIKETLDEFGATYTVMEDSEIINRVSKELQRGHVVGWFQGRMEFGPRALGNRSILGDPTNPEMQRKLNLKIKFRESFRPFACSILRENLSDYFEMDYDSPYMLLVSHVKKSRRKNIKEDKEAFGIDKLNILRSDVPAITHVDFSTRIQTVHKETSPRYYNLIKKYGEDTGHPVIVNTSFNVRGEPIVCSPLDAFVCFMNTEMDYLVLENFFLDKKEQKIDREKLSRYTRKFGPD